MKALLLTMLLAFAASPSPAQTQLVLTNANTKYNYAFGMDVVSTFQQFDVDIDTKAFLAGMKDALAGNPALTEEEKKAALESLSKQMNAKAEEKLKVIGDENLRDGEVFLAANAKKDGVQSREVTARDGSRVALQYKVLQSGPPGPSPQLSDTVEVHYVGSLIDGTVFDSSVKRGIPATFGISDVMPGWREALLMMKAGDKWELYLPAQLAFGEKGFPNVGPDSVVIFDIELRSFYTPAKAAPNPSVKTPATAPN